jgi:Spy/CpxP family protein refolding chaperone
MKRALYMLALLCAGLAGGWLGRSLIHPLHGRHGRWGEGPGPGEPPPIEHFLKDAGLTPEQTAKIRDLDTAAREKGKPLRDQLDERRRAFQDALGTDAGPDVLKARYQELLDAKRADELAHFETMMAVREILTPDQRRLLEERHRHHGELRGP